MPRPPRDISSRFGFLQRAEIRGTLRMFQRDFFTEWLPDYLRESRVTYPLMNLCLTRLADTGQPLPRWEDPVAFLRFRNACIVQIIYWMNTHRDEMSNPNEIYFECVQQAKELIQKYTELLRRMNSHLAVAPWTDPEIDPPFRWAR